MLTATIMRSPNWGIGFLVDNATSGEPFLRMSCTGAAPLTAAGAPNSNNLAEGNQYAVMVRFPFAGPSGGNQVSVDNLSYGTALPLGNTGAGSILACADLPGDARLSAPAGKRPGAGGDLYSPPFPRGLSMPAAR